jgi:serpin B
MRPPLLLPWILLLAVLVGCTDSTNAPDTGRDPGIPNPVSPEQVDDRLVEANNRFAFNIFSELLAGGAAPNVFISPSSIAFALTMTLNGAGGDTFDDMATALEVGDWDLPQINQGNATLISWLQQAEPKVQLSIANSLWARKGVTFYPDFMERNETYFGAEVTTLDFADPGAPQTINDWVSKSTHGKIENIVETIPWDAILYLINAIYFNGKWTTSFDEDLTMQQPFHLPDGTKILHPIMNQHGWYPYLRGDGFQAVSLPYGDDERMSMYVFLPDKNSSLNEFLSTLDEAHWSQWVGQFRKAEGDIGLPRFEIEYEQQLKDALTALGMGIAFAPAAADFSNMLPVSGFANAFISKVLHKTYIRVDEEGTEAAAVTSVEITFTSMPEYFSLVADRPFFFAIRDNETGTIVFMGTVVEPR